MASNHSVPEDPGQRERQQKATTELTTLPQKPTSSHARMQNKVQQQHLSAASKPSQSSSRSSSSLGSFSPADDRISLPHSDDAYPTSPHHIHPPNQLPRSPSPMYRHHSGASSPNTRSPSPPVTPSQIPLTADSGGDTPRSGGGDSGAGVVGGDGSCSGVSDATDSKTERKPKSVSFHSHTNWKSERKIQNGEYLKLCVPLGRGKYRAVSIH